MELAELQDREVGDGTTSVVIFAAELLKVLILGFSSQVVFSKPSDVLKGADLVIYCLIFGLQRANDLVKHKIHPTSIISGYRVSILFVCIFHIQDC